MKCFSQFCNTRHSLQSVFVLQYLGTGNGMALNYFTFHFMYNLFYYLFYLLL
jgi:hypothetical protein